MPFTNNASEAEVTAAMKQAEAQVCHYAETMNVNDNIGHTTLHKVYIILRYSDGGPCRGVRESRPYTLST